jgi:hypothetical protein
MPKLFSAVLICIILTMDTIAGQSQSSTESKVKLASYGCEGNQRSLDEVGNMALSQKEGGETIFVIARLGKDEVKRELNSRRLYNVKLYLVNHMINPEKIILAEGQRVKNKDELVISDKHIIMPGRVEVYVGGMLICSLVADSGKDLCVECCDYDPKYYLQPRQKTKIKDLFK